MEYSVLMSVYYKEKAKYLQISMESIAKQTKPTNDFVLVCDGPLTDDLNYVIEKMKILFGDVLTVVRLPENMGLGIALNEGLQYCKNEIIARMDSDDIAFPERCEKQYYALMEKGVDIVGAGVDEFADTPNKITAKRVPPETHNEIIEFAKRRNPFNHPCVMYRKAAVEAAGGYQEFYLLEDYYLWLRMLLNGSIGYNLQESLLWMRAGSDLYKRRSGWKYVKSQWKLFRYMYQNEFISVWNLFFSCLIRFGSSVVPNVIRERMFCILMRK